MLNEDDKPVLDFAVRPNRLHWPPLLYALTLGAAYALSRLVPLPRWDDGPVSKAVGIALLATGLGIAILGALALIRAKTTIDPTGSAKRLMQDGIYRLTRNPMYLGGVLTFAGLGILLRSAWLVLLVVPMAVGLQYLAIRREERHLEVRFGDAYRSYKASVPRWLGPL